MDVRIEASWKQRLAPEFEKDYFVHLTEFGGANTRALTYTHLLDLSSMLLTSAHLIK